MHNKGAADARDLVMGFVRLCGLVQGRQGGGHSVEGLDKVRTGWGLRRPLTTPASLLEVVDSGGDIVPVAKLVAICAGAAVTDPVRVVGMEGEAIGFREGRAPDESLGKPLVPRVVEGPGARIVIAGDRHRFRSRS